MKYKWSWSFCLLLSTQAWAAVPRSLSVSNDQGQLVREALKLPFENRVQALKNQGAKAPRVLSSLIVNRQENLELRWRAMTALPLVDPALGRVHVEQALASDEWYMRNAAAIALPSLERTYAVDESAKLLSDPALVVRTAAAQNLLRLNAREKETLLWQKLNSHENFHHGESLWVRRHIARALSELASQGNERKFAALLRDPDRRVHPFAIRGLERLTGHRFATKSTEETRQKWLAWAQTNQTP